MENLFSEFYQIMSSEWKLRSDLVHREIGMSDWAAYMADVTFHISEAAQNAFVLKSYSNIYGLTTARSTDESSSARTSLMAMIVDRALGYQYGAELDEQNIDGFTYRQIMETVRIYNLPRNSTGDILDNSSESSRKKNIGEDFYFGNFFPAYTSNNPNLGVKVKQLISEMRDKSTSIGKLLFCADKVAAIVMALQHDKNGNPPRLSMKSKNASTRDRAEMRICDKKDVFGRRYASEMWTVDWFKARRLCEYDETGFFTALIVMYTLKVHRSWYKWRERDYVEL